MMKKIQRYKITKPLLGSRLNITFNCPLKDCGAELSANENEVGERDMCPNCGTRFQLDPDRLAKWKQARTEEQEDAERKKLRQRTLNAEEEARKNRDAQEMLAQLSDSPAEQEPRLPPPVSDSGGTRGAKKRKRPHVYFKRFEQGVNLYTNIVMAVFFAGLTVAVCFAIYVFAKSGKSSGDVQNLIMQFIWMFLVAVVYWVGHMISMITINFMRSALRYLDRITDAVEVD